jgi:hypothetical protein
MYSAVPRLRHGAQPQPRERVVSDSQSANEVYLETLSVNLDNECMSSLINSRCTLMILMILTSALLEDVC